MSNCSKGILPLLLTLFLLPACHRPLIHLARQQADPQLTYKKYKPRPEDKIISRTAYLEKLYGFWLGQCIANWTGLITEMDKIGGAGKEGRGAGFYTRENWGGPDEPNIWNSNPLFDTIKMYDFVKSQYQAGATWEAARDALHEKYQVRQEDGYEWAAKDTVCNGCFAAGINFGASIISLLYGEGDIRETIKIGALAGWDSDNPTATWGGLLGFMIGKRGIEQAFGRPFAEKFNIHRTRVGFPDNGMDTFYNMAQKGVFIVDRVVQEEMGGGVDLEKGTWYVPVGGVPVGD